MNKHSILLIEDNLPLARTYEGYLSQQPYRVFSAATAQEAREHLSQTDFDVILLDIMLPDISGIDLLKELREMKKTAAVIMITADGSVNQAVEAMQLGAQDYLLKPFSASRLHVTIKNALEKRDLKKAVERYKQEFDRSGYCDFIGSSLAMQAVYRIVDSAASSNATIFIEGQSGTGKELMARAIHQKSPRANKRFVALNCAAIPTELMESEIFGHVKGAFTGANESRDGAAHQADQGTLFFDEICEMDITLQAKLLRFIQTGTVQKVGSDKLQKVDIRFVCATNRDPMQEVEAGRFREDLYYRLHIIPATLPPLKEREGDIEQLAYHFLELYAKEEDKDFCKFAPEVIQQFETYSWPGNIRELQNVIRRIVVLNSHTIVSQDMLPSVFESGHRERKEIPRYVSNNGVSSNKTGGNDVVPMWKIELDHIQAALKTTDNNVPRAAALLEISPSTIYRRMKEIG